MRRLLLIAFSIIALVAAVVFFSSNYFKSIVHSVKLTKEFVQFCDGEEYVCGFIDETFEEKISALIDQGVSQIKISSQGGYLLSSMRIARQLKQANIAVVIDGVCLSACAQNIFLAVDDVSVTNRSFVAFHNSATSSSLVAKNWEFESTEKLKRFLQEGREVKKAEIEFFKEFNLDMDALLVPTAAMNFTCLFPNMEDHFIGVVYKHQSDADWFIPHKKQILQWRNQRDFVGWPESIQEVSARMESYPTFINSNILIFGGEYSANGLKQHIRSLKTCES